MIEELRKLLKHTAIYGMGSVLAKVVGFFMIPFYTHYLTPTDYGVLELLELSLSLAALVLTMWLNASVIRHYNDFDQDRDRKQAVSTIFLVACAIGIAVAILGIRLSKPLSSLILNTPDLHYFVSLEAVSFLVTCVNVVCLSYLRAQQRSVVIVGTNLISLIMALGLNIYFIAIRHSGAVGVLYSSLISGTLTTAVLAAHLIKNAGLSFSLAKLRAIAAFGGPLIITSVAAFTVNFSDRFFLRHFSTIATVGIYALGYKFGFILSLLIVQPFDMIWQARLYEIERRSGSGDIFARLFEYYTFVLIFAALALSMAIKEVLFVTTPREFHAAATVVPIVALAYVFQGVNRFFLAGAYIAKNTMQLGVTGLACALTNVVLNLLLIPRYGMLGAAWSTTASFFLMAALAHIVSQKVYRIPYVFSRVLTITCLSIVTYLVADRVSLSSIALQIICKATLLAALPIGLYLGGFFSDREMRTGKALAQQLLGKYGILKVAISER